MFALKAGVDVRGLKPEMIWAALATYDVLGHVRDDGFTITSQSEGRHMPGSRHNDGYAFDVRTRHMAPQVVQYAAKQIRGRLGTQYDVVVESDHLHIEFDPRGQ